MNKINVDALRAKFFERTGRKVSPDDPVLDVVILSQIVIEWYATTFATEFSRKVESERIILTRSAGELRHALNNLMQEQSASLASHQKAIAEAEAAAAERIRSLQEEVVKAIEALFDGKTMRTIETSRAT